VKRVPLAAREREATRLVSLGLRNDEIAARMDVSIETTKTQIRKSLAKLGATNRASAVAIAIRTGVIE
jgi:DNA-binding CsgD family transcriptional regulator